MSDTKTGNLTGEFTYDGGTIAVLEVDNGDWIAAEPRIADDLLTAVRIDGEVVTVNYETWQIV